MVLHGDHHNVHTAVVMQLPDGASIYVYSWSDIALRPPATSRCASRVASDDDADSVPAARSRGCDVTYRSCLSAVLVTLDNNGVMIAVRLKLY